MSKSFGPSFLVAALAVTGCAPAAKPSSSVSIRVLDEARAPVRGASLVGGNDSVVGVTDDEGRAVVTLSGPVGATSRLEVRCPAAYRSPSEPVTVRRLEASDAMPEYAAKCARGRHALVIAVRAEGGPNLPVLHHGKEIARTDASGGAHVLVEGAPRERVELVLSTAEPSLAALHPQNPAATFEVRDEDDLALFSVTFTRDRKPVMRAAARPGPKAF